MRRSRFEQLELRRLLTVESSVIPVLNFEPTEFVSLGSNEEAAALQLADLNNDGHDDFIIAQSGSLGLQVAIRQASNEEAAYDRIPFIFPGEVSDIETVDINGDRFLDVIAVGTAGTAILLNEGNDAETGVWQQLSASVFLIGAADDVSVGDVNGDQVPDALLGMRDNVRMLHLTSEGKVDTDVNYTTTAGDRLTQLADINGDAHLDIIVAVPQTGDVSILVNDGSGFFEGTAAPFSVGDTLTVLHVADANSDSISDLIVGNGTQDPDNLSIWAGRGDGTFSDVPQTFGILGPITQIDSADYDGDQDLDLLVTHRGTFHHPINGNGPGGASLVLGNGAGRFHQPMRVQTNALIDSAFVDFDQDGTLDIVSLQQSDGSAVVAAQRATGLLPNEAVNVTFESSTTFGIYSQLVDVDNDGFFEFVTVTEPEPGVTVVSMSRRETDGTFITVDDTTVDVMGTAVFGANAPVTIGDFNGDGIQEVVLIGNDSGGESKVIVLPITTSNGSPNGDLAFFDAIDFQVPTGQWSLAKTADFNADGRDDFIVHDSNSSEIYIFVGQPISGASPFLLGSVFSVPSAVTVEVTDLTQDGFDDLVVESGASETVVLQGLGDGTFVETATLNGGFPTLGDFDGDGNQDIVSTSLFDKAIVSYGQSDGTFEDSVTVTSFGFLDSPLSGAEDINGDSISDLIIGDDVYFGSAEGFSNPVDYDLDFGGDVAIDDLNVDGAADLFTLANGSLGQGFKFATYVERQGLPGGEYSTDVGRRVLQFSNFVQLKSEDLDNDGDLDTVIFHNDGFAVLMNDTAQPSADLNNDGVEDPSDIDHLCEQFGATDAATLADFDLTNDGRIDVADTTWLVEELFATELGDTNLDGEVGFVDFLGLSRNFGQEKSGWANGDFNCDGTINFVDFLQLAENFGQG